MAISTKDLILNHLSELSENFDFTQVNHFTASSISDELHISRSLASQYLNELVKEDVVIKVNSRPVYFFHRKMMEEIYQTKFQRDDFYDLEEVKEYIGNHSKGEGDYSKVIGSDKSLAGVIKQLREGFEYPPSGLPLVVYGENGTGKRKLCTTVFENAARKGLVDEDTKIFKIEFTSTNGLDMQKKVFGTKDNKGIIDLFNQIVFLFCSVEYMPQEFQRKICQLIEFDKNQQNRLTNNKCIRSIFISESNPILYMQEGLLKNIPIIIKFPTFKEKSNEEKEELIIYFIQEEAKRMGKNIKMSNVALRALVNGDYERNLTDLQSTIRIMCASAFRKSSHHSETIIHTYDLPEHLLATMPILTNEEVVYIDTATFEKSDQIDFVLDYFERIIVPLVKNENFDEALADSKHSFDLLGDYLSYKQRILPEQIKGIETSFSNIIDIVLKKRYMNLPSGFCCTIAKLIYINDMYSSSIQRWCQENRTLIDEALLALNNHLVNESMIVEDISRLMNNNLEIEMTDLLSIMMMVYLHHYNTQQINRKTFGMIVCHGYSTATSIAEAVNSLLGAYVFDAVDMPLDITLAEIREILLEKLNRMNNNADVIIMVDMGSLEQLGKSLSMVINCNVGVINNVSTRLALNVGQAILNEKDIKTTLKKVSDASQASFKIIERKKNDTILFTSESGIHMAQRIRELFSESLHSQVSLDLEVCDYNQLVTNGEGHEIFSMNNVLFITGTSNPHIENHIFIGIEDIISGNNIDIMTSQLSKYLSIDELNCLLDDLRKNFTLQNVVGYLTILNPKVLLDNVSLAVDVLQSNLGKKFNGKILIGIYIHVCCLIERLVTKTAITEFDGLKGFEEENQGFIKVVNNSFQTLSKRYNVSIPVSEIAYLYDFILADEEDLNKKELLLKIDRNR